MQVGFFIYLIRNTNKFRSLSHLPEFQRLLSMNYKTEVSNSNISDLLDISKEHLDVKVELFENSGYHYFKVNDLSNKSKISSWHNIVDAKINALIYILR